MERESFENEEVGRILNEHFISVKVDREERPDVDAVYMNFIQVQLCYWNTSPSYNSYLYISLCIFQASSGQGGWPMSVWLTPDLKPIIGGTYFPPEDSLFGRPGFKTVLQRIQSKVSTRSEV